MKAKNLFTVMLCGLSTGVIFFIIKSILLAVFAEDISTLTETASYDKLGTEYFFAVDLLMGIWAISIFSATSPKPDGFPKSAILIGIAWWALKTLQSANWVGLGFLQLDVNILAPAIVSLVAALLAIMVGGSMYIKAQPPKEETRVTIPDYCRPTKKAVSELSVDKAIELVKMYEESASIVKTRTWTITTWILTLNSGLLAFAFKLYTDHRDVDGFLLLELSITIVGIALCIFLIVLIRDQGKHLQHYWTAENRVGAWNENVKALVVAQEDFSKVDSEGYNAPFPRFCERLLALAWMFLCGFMGQFLVMAHLHGSL